jgi:membrane protein
MTGVLVSGRRHARVAAAWGRAQVYRVLDTVPPVRRTVDELLRVEFIDRATVVAAQALLALVPLVVVLATFLPTDLTSTSVDRFGDLTGLSQTAGDTVTDQVEPLRTSTALRAQTGIAGLVVTVLSASSFARAVMRLYERVWAVPSLRGMHGRRRAFGWLFGWLLALQVTAVVAWAGDRLGSLAVGPVLGSVVVSGRLVLQAGLLSLLWWWSMRVLLARRVTWRRLALPAALTGTALTAYSAGSTVVMPHYASSSVHEFGTFGLVLAIATWLVGVAVVLAVAAVVGRVLVEDAFTRDLAARARRRVVLVWSGVSRHGG